MKILPRLFAASLVFVLSWVLFRQVLAAAVAGMLAGILALAELLADGGFGGGMRLFVRLGGSLIIWPIAAWLLDAAGMSDRRARIAVAAAVASAAGVLAAGHGSGKETVRLWAVVAACALPLYALMRVLLAAPTDSFAVAAGCVAVGVALLVARQAIVWPHYQSRALLIAAGSVAAAGTLAAGLAFLHV